MDCHAARIALQLHLDGELDPAERAAFERHLESCAECRAALAAEQALRASIRSLAARHRASSGLAGRIAAGLTEPAPGREARRWYWRTPALAAAALLLFLAGTAVGYWGPGRNGGDLALHDVVSAHLRALASERLTDVASSDQHTVKPWFNGRVELSPPVEDLTAEGFALVGGRVDFVGERRVAALVYRHKQHVVTLFISPSSDASPGTAARQGFNVVHWNGAGMRFWAVSDLNHDDLERFAVLLRSRIPAK